MEERLKTSSLISEGMTLPPYQQVKQMPSA